MCASPGEVVGLEIQGFQCGEAFFSELRKLVEELLEGFALRLSRLGEAVEGIEGPGFAVFEDDS